MQRNAVSLQIEQLLKKKNFTIILTRKGLLDTEREISSQNYFVLVMECNSHFLIQKKEEERGEE